MLELSRLFRVSDLARVTRSDAFKMRPITEMSTILVYIPKLLPKMRRILMIIMALLDVAYVGQSVSGIHTYVNCLGFYISYDH